MMYRNRSRCLAICLLLIAALCAPALSAQTAKPLAPGVTLLQEVSAAPGALIVNCVTVDMESLGVKVKAAVGHDVVCGLDWRKGRENISAMTARKNALVGANADFFPFTGDPLGVCIVDGELVSEPGSNRVAVGILGNGSAFFDNPRFDARLTLARGVSRQIDGINRGRETNQVVLYTESYGESTQTKYKGTDIICTSADLPVRAGKPVRLTVTEVKLDAMDTAIPKGGAVLSAGGPAAYFLKENLQPGDTFTVQFDVKSASCYDWSLVEQAVGGGPWLLKDGKQFITYGEEGFGAGFSTTKHPRTALGLTESGKLMVVTVDGRQTISGGISLPDLAAVMMRLGAVNAINLDGGGSSTLSVKGIVVNVPSEGEERPVANGLLVYAPPQPVEELPNLAISGVGAEVPSGQGVQLCLTWGEDARPLSSEQSANVVWGATGGVGFVDQCGYFIPVKPRKGTVNAIYGSQIVSAPVSVVLGPPANIKVEIVADKQDPLRATLNVTVYDVSYNRLAGREVTVAVVGGKPDAQTGITGEKGEFATGITWDAAAADRGVSAVSGDVKGEAKVETKDEAKAPAAR